jgi:Zn-dependent peptidase ImmA (M78 family)
MNKLDLSRMDLADFTNVSGIASNLLQQIRNQCGGNVPIPVPIEEIALSLEIEEISSMPTESFEGMLVITDERGFIFFNEASHIKRQRFTIGHELGHWLIPSHRNGDKAKFSCSKKQTELSSISKKSKPEDKIEVEANRFSSEILIPEREFKRDIRVFNQPDITNLKYLSDLYNTSLSSICLRYVKLSDFSCAIIQSFDYQIKNIFPSKSFPKLSISLKEGSPIPPRSRTALPTKAEISETLPVDWVNWLEEKPDHRAELYEQVLIQRGDYRTTLLFFDDSKCPDEEEMEAEARSEWNPTFKK